MLVVRTIRFQIALLTGGLLLLLLVGFGLFLYASFRAQLYRTLDDSLRLNAEQMLASLENEDGQPRLERGGYASFGLSNEDDLARLVSPSGAILGERSSRTVPIPTLSIRDGGGLFTVPYIDREDGEAGADQDVLRLLSVPVVVEGRTLAYLQVGRDLEPLREILGRLLTLLLLAGPAVIVIAAAGGYWLAGRALAPIEAIRQRAASLSAQDLSQRLDMSLPDDEVGRLAHTFNEMLERLDESFRRQRRFTADASHELRTPLAVIQGEVDVTLEQPRTQADYVEALASIGDESERMSRLINELLLLARSDADELPLHCEALDLADLLRVLAGELQAQARATDVNLTVDLPQPLPVYADADRMLQLFINLLENAFTYASGSRVILSGRRRAAAVVISVADSGPGIAPEHLPHLFERFYRVDKARSRKSGGSGLGLAIVQEIVQAHRGEIAVESSEHRGTVFTVWLPCTGDENDG